MPSSLIVTGRAASTLKNVSYKNFLTLPTLLIPNVTVEYSFVSAASTVRVNNSVFTMRGAFKNKIEIQTECTYSIVIKSGSFSQLFV